MTNDEQKKLAAALEALRAQLEEFTDMVGKIKFAGDSPLQELRVTAAQMQRAIREAVHEHIDEENAL